MADATTSWWGRSFVAPLAAGDGRARKRAVLALLAIFAPIGVASSYLTQANQFTGALSLLGALAGLATVWIAARAPVEDGHDGYWSWFVTLVGVAQILGFAQLREEGTVLLPELCVLPFFAALYLPTREFRHSLRVTAGVALVILVWNLEAPLVALTIAITLVSALCASFLAHQVVLALRHSNQELDEARALAERLATTDVLTGAPNRQAVGHRVAAGPGGGSAVVLVDADRFKAVNDRFGHAVGDEVLRTLYHRLCDQVPGVWVARWGGEEFVVLSVGDGPVDVAALAQAVRGAVAVAPLLTTAGPVPMTVSVGATSWAAGESFDAAVGRADAALYAAKAAGRDRAEVAAPFDGSGAVALASSPGRVRPT